MGASLDCCLRPFGQVGSTWRSIITDNVRIGAAASAATAVQISEERWSDELTGSREARWAPRWRAIFCLSELLPQILAVINGRFLNGKAPNTVSARHV